MANLTQTPAQVQADLDAVEASNVGLDSVTDGSDTQATALKKSGFFGLAESTTDAPTTDRAVMLTIARDVDAVGEIRHGQIVLTEPGNAYFTVDDGGTLGTWSQIATTAGSQTLTNKALNGTLGATTPASASVTTLNASGATTLSSTLDVTGAATLAGLTATGKILSSSANIDAVGAVTTADSAIGYKLGNLGGNAFIFKNTSAGGGFSGAAANALSIGTTNTARVELAVNNAVGSYQDTAGFNVLGTLGVTGATTLSSTLSSDVHTITSSTGGVNTLNITNSNASAPYGIYFDASGFAGDAIIYGLRIDNSGGTAHQLFTDGSSIHAGGASFAGDVSTNTGGDIESNGFFSTGGRSEVTIASGAITVTRTWHSVDTEGDAGTDDLTTINGGSDGRLLILIPASGARTVVCKDGTGNLSLAGDCSLDADRDSLTLMYESASGQWFEIARSNNA